MGSLGSPKLWIPYINSKDCSLGFCSLYCPQWCYVVYPPPPPLDFSGDDDGGSTFSPLIIAVIGILTAAFLLVSYFTLVSKYCRNSNNHNDDNQRTTRARFSRENPFRDDDVAWHVATSSTEGLDEALIKKIPVIKYKKGDGVVEGTATTEHCSVCLGEFREDDRLRALPTCSHAFHVECIDMWLRSHSNCPLCRANVEIAALSGDGDQSDTRGESVLSDNASGENDVSTARVLNDLDENHSISTPMEVRDSMRRSVSMDFSRPDRVYVVDILRSSEEEEQEEGFDGKVNCSKSNGSDRRNYNKNVNRLHVRSVSSGRFFLTRSIIGAGKGKMSSNSVFPM